MTFFKLVPTHRLLFSFGFFLVCMALDFSTTDFYAQGNTSLEGNAIARIWWQMTGTLHHLDIFIWVVGVFVVSYIILQKSEFLALWWLNGLAFAHVMGFLSWLHYGFLDIFYSHIPNDQLIATALSLAGLVLGLPVAYLQIYIRNGSVPGFKALLK